MARTNIVASGSTRPEMNATEMSYAAALPASEDAILRPAFVDRADRETPEPPAVEFLSGHGPNKGGSQELGSQGSTAEIRNVTPADTVRILNDVRDYAMKLTASNGKTATIGFCWGGGTSFNYALQQPALNAAVSYYGPMPADPAAYDKAKAPILGLYGGNDARVNGNIPVAQAELKKRNVTYDPHTFEGAGHGFLRQQAGSQNAPGNMKATEQAWPLTLEFLRKHTS